MTSKEMLRTQCKPGYWFVNLAPLGSKPNWKQQPAPVKNKGPDTMPIDSEYDPGENDREDPDMPDDYEPEEDYYPRGLYGN